METLKEDARVIEKILHLIQHSNCNDKNKKNMASAMYEYAGLIGAKVRLINYDAKR